VSQERPDTYRSPLGRWDTHSWVRAKPHQMAPFEPQLEFFSAELSPILEVSSVGDLSAERRRRLLILHLYYWLHFTEWLEMGPVNAACDLIRQPSFWPWLSAKMKADALKIYVDEGGHAEMSHALFARVETETGVAAAPIRSLDPAAKQFFDSMLADAGSAMAPLLTIFFACVSETLITGTLKDLPKDFTVQVAVRDLAADHAADEAVHHAYFRSLFALAWPRLDEEQRRLVGGCLAEMILAFLQPDADALQLMLADVAPGVDGAAAVKDLFGLEERRRQVRDAALPTLRLFAAEGVFDSAEVRTAFEQAGLRPPASAANLA
jgi:P-aminobenzoate N-oxygenase AurF